MRSMSGVGEKWSRVGIRIPMGGEGQARRGDSGAPLVGLWLPPSINPRAGGSARAG